MFDQIAGLEELKDGPRVVEVVGVAGVEGVAIIHASELGLELRGCHASGGTVGLDVRGKVVLDLQPSFFLE